MIVPRATRWLWEGRGSPARTARAALLPAAGLYWTVVQLRALGHARGWLATHSLPLPAVAVGNLAVGGTGKTPLAAWMAAHFRARGARPAILLRGYGGDEPLVHQRLTPGVLVVADPDRRAGAARARAAGADMLVLDDAFQRLDVARDLNVAVLSAESARWVRWPLPAGPWRESWGALRRADLVVVTRKRAPAEAAAAMAGDVSRRRPGIPVAVAHLAVRRCAGMASGRAVDAAGLAGRRVVVAAAIGDPWSLAAQVEALGAVVAPLIPFPDHYGYGPGDVRRLVRAAAAADYLIVTEKDAVKLRTQWPRDAREPLVAVLSVEWERDGTVVTAELDALLARRPAATPTPDFR